MPPVRSDGRERTPTEVVAARRVSGVKYSDATPRSRRSAAASRARPRRRRRIAPFRPAASPWKDDSTDDGDGEETIVLEATAVYERERDSCALSFVCVTSSETSLLHRIHRATHVTYAIRARGRLTRVPTPHPPTRWRRWRCRTSSSASRRERVEGPWGHPARPT